MRNERNEDCKRVSKGEIYKRVKKRRKLQRGRFCLYLMAVWILDGLLEGSMKIVKYRFEKGKRSKT